MSRTDSATTDLERVDVLGVGISPTTIPRAADRVERWIADSIPAYVTVTGVHGVVETLADPGLLPVHNQAGMVVPDGMPMVWSAHHAGIRWVERVYGPDLMLELCTRAAANGHRIYLYGGKEGTPELLTERLSERFPGINIVGGYSPPFRAVTEEEDAAIVEAINATKPDIVFVGLSTPKQERWMHAHTDRIPSVLLGVGAAFDFHAGNLEQAPAWMQQRGLEWLFRLIKEPRRLARRYLIGNPKFVAAITRRHPRLVPTDTLAGALGSNAHFPTPAQEASPS